MLAQGYRILHRGVIEILLEVMARSYPFQSLLWSCFSSRKLSASTRVCIMPSPGKDRHIFVKAQSLSRPQLSDNVGREVLTGQVVQVSTDKLQICKKAFSMGSHALLRPTYCATASKEEAIAGIAITVTHVTASPGMNTISKVMTAYPDPFEMIVLPYKTAQCQQNAWTDPTQRSKQPPAVTLVENQCYTTPYRFSSLFTSVDDYQLWRLNSTGGGGGCQIFYFEAPSCSGTAMNVNGGSPIPFCGAPGCSSVEPDEVASMLVTCGTADEGVTGSVQESHIHGR
ncbi:hypothetical protein FH972_025851 [Carpinus fangiana]|uniref:Uncharacterized protein n=1 Tax=Carpinus fangiana TaxID=176857 RepID=A0A5N6L2S2_9ROSI|nr:hypothetical protein FH972_025851 [Carpinus fangiana]